MALDFEYMYMEEMRNGRWVGSPGGFWLLSAKRE